MLLFSLMGKVEAKSARRETLNPGEISGMQWRYTQLGQEVARLNQTIDQQKHKIGLLECERDDLKLQLKRVPEPTPAPDVIELGLEEELNEAKKTNQKLQQKVDRMQEPQSEQLKKLEEELKEAKRDNWELKLKLNQRPPPPPRVNTHQFKQMEKELASVKRKYTNLLNEREQADIRAYREKKRDSSFSDSSPRSARSDGISERRDRSLSIDDERRKYEERKERVIVLEREKKLLLGEKMDLESTLENLQRTLDNTRTNYIRLEAEKKMWLVSTNNQKAPAESKSRMEMQKDLDDLQTKNIHNEFVKAEMRKKLDEALEVSKKYPKLLDSCNEMKREKEMLEERLKEQQANFAADLSQLEQDKKAAQEMCAVLTNTSQGELHKQVEAGKKRIQQLERQLQEQAGCSSPKRSKWEGDDEEEKAPPPFPPFVLQGKAIIPPKMSDLRAPSKWKAFGAPIKNTISRPEIIPAVPETIKQSLDALTKRSHFDYRSK